jgi:hypothetical protein
VSYYSSTQDGRKHYWVVHVTIPRKQILHDGREYTHKYNETFGTIAQTIDEAIAAVRRDHPEIEAVWRVNHQGEIKVEA